MEYEIRQLIEELIDREGGYIHHPADRGGPTIWGITQNTARKHGYSGDMQHMPQNIAAQIYERIYWSGSGFKKIATHAPKLAAELFDTGVNMGVATASGFLQRALNALNRTQKDYRDIKVDRHIGAQSMAALSAFFDKRGPAGELVLIKAVEALQGAHYLQLAENRPSQEAFLYGWLSNRIG